MNAAPPTTRSPPLHRLREREESTASERGRGEKERGRGEKERGREIDRQQSGRWLLMVHLTVQTHCMKAAIHSYPSWTSSYPKHSTFRQQPCQFPPQLDLMARRLRKTGKIWVLSLRSTTVLEWLEPRNASPRCCVSLSANQVTAVLFNTTSGSIISH